MLDGVHGGPVGEQMLKMTGPPRRILAGAVALGLGPIQHRLDAAPHPARGLVLGFPDRLDHAHDQPGVDLADRTLAEHRVRVGREGGLPLRLVFRIPELDRLGGEELLEALIEADAVGRLSGFARPDRGRPGGLCGPPWRARGPRRG
jgi:hypothetical protein